MLEPLFGFFLVQTKKKNSLASGRQGRRAKELRGDKKKKRGGKGARAGEEELIRF
jgi:hypothetical protein